MNVFLMIHMTKGYQVHAAHNSSNHPDPSQATTRAAQTTSLELQNTSDNIETNETVQHSSSSYLQDNKKCFSVSLYLIVTFSEFPKN